MGKKAQRRHERMMMQRTDAQLAEQRALREEAEQTTAAAKQEYREFEFENPFEDLTVDTTTFDLQREMGDQARANIMSQFRGVAGGSGIAGLAQSLANQGTLQARQITADIARQEKQNEMMYRQGEQMVASAEAGRVSTMYGAELGNLAGARAGFQAAQANEMAAMGAIAQMQSARMGMWGDIVGGVAQGAGTYFASDRKLKKNIEYKFDSPSGVPVYNFEYIDDKYGSGIHQGVMSDEVPLEAVSMSSDGFEMVNYSMLDVEFKKLK